MHQDFTFIKYDSPPRITMERTNSKFLGSFQVILSHGFVCSEYYVAFSIQFLQSLMS